jgi:aminoacyl tRNA synthase complex-interacting multifunctional protein 1
MIANKTIALLRSYLGIPIRTEEEIDHSTLIANACGIAKQSKRLVGETREEQLVINDWLTACSQTFSGVEFENDSSDAIEQLNEHLVTRSHLAVNTRVSICDLLVFCLIHEDVKRMNAQQMKQRKHLVRWMKRMDCVLKASERGFESIDFTSVDAVLITFPFPRSEKNVNNEKAQVSEGVVLGGSQPLDDPVAEEKRLKAIAKKEAKAAEKQAAKAARAAEAVAASGGEGSAAVAAPTAGATATGEKEVDVSVVDIRVGKIIKAWEHPEADKLWAEEIDVGLEKPLQVCSGLREFKTIDEMQGADVLVICNMKPTKMRGLESAAMVLCASNDDHTKVDFVCPPKGAKVGERVCFEGFEGEPEKVLNPKKKQLEKVLPKLKTDSDGIACYDGKKAMTSAGACVSSLKDCFIK